MLWCLVRSFIMRPYIIRANMFTIYMFAILLLLGFNVALPTETVYGLFAIYWNSYAVDGIYVKKGRSRTNPLIVHVSCLEDVYKFGITRMSNKEQLIFKILAEKLWPGACTFVVKANIDKVISIIRNDSLFIGIRVPDNEITREVLRITGPTVGPSANRSGKVSPTTAEHVDKDYYGLSTFMPILKSLTQKSTKSHGIESTIVKIEETDNGDVNIILLRAGAIGHEQIRDCLVEHTFTFHYTIDVNIDCVNNSTSVAPGQEITHYAPDTQTLIGSVFDRYTKSSVNRQNSVLIAIEKNVVKYGGKYKKNFILPSTDEECASVLYSIMRDADAYCKENQVSTIVICTDELTAKNKKSGYIDAIHDKLVRASSGNPYVRL